MDEEQLAEEKQLAQEVTTVLDHLHDAIQGLTPLRDALASRDVASARPSDSLLLMLEGVDVHLNDLLKKLQTLKGQ